MSMLKLEGAIEHQTDFGFSMTGPLRIEQPRREFDDTRDPNLVLLSRDQAAKFHAALGEWLSNETLWLPEVGNDEDDGEHEAA